MSRPIRARIAAALLVVTGTAVTAPLTTGAAVAAPASPTAGLHCVVAIDGVGGISCGDTIEQARTRSAVPRAYILGARLFDATGFDPNAGTLTIEVPQRAPGRGCTDGYDNEGPLYLFQNMGAYGWGNRASSVRTFNHCDIKLYDVAYPSDLSAGSTWIDEYGNLAGLGGGWNNRASAVRLS